jgi:hypothetical protein
LAEVPKGQMKFNVKKPCKDCPFRRDVHPFLHRAPEIAKSLSDDHNWFACHETTGIGTGERVRAKDQSHCIGAAIVLWRSNMVNIAMRLALAVGLLDQSVLDQPQPIFNSLEEFTEHHAKC